LKVIIPVAGIGKRLRPHTYTLPKALIEVAGKPILGHILERISKIDPQEVIIIVSHMEDKIKDYVAQNFKLNSSYVKQREALGLGHAIFLAKERVSAEEPLLIILGDTILDANFYALCKSKTNMIGVKEIEDPRRFGIAEVDGDIVKRLVEKPSHPTTNLALIGLYYIVDTDKLFESLNEIIERDIKTVGEYQLTDGLDLMLKKGNIFKIFNVDGWYDCGKPEALLDTNRYLLEKSHKLVEINGSIIIPPVFVHPSSNIEHSIIGPYVSVAGNSTIKYSIVSDSIINSGAYIERMLLSRSIIGSNAEVYGKYEHLDIGDSSKVNID